MSASPPEPLDLPGHDSVPIRVWDHGGDGPPLLLSHCTGGVARLWDPVIRALGAGYRCIAIDSRGHGDSGSPRDRQAYVWEHSARDVLCVADALGLAESITAIGHSAGGAHVLRAAQRAPGRFARLALIDAIVVPPGFFTGENPLAARARKRRASFPGRAAARRRFASKPPMETWDAAALDAYVRHGIGVSEDGVFRLKCRPEVEAWCYELAGMPEAFASLPSLQCPVLLVTGEHSEVRKLVALQAGRLPHARVEVLPGVGHFVPQEAPEALAEVLRAWLAEA